MASGPTYDAAMRLVETLRTAREGVWDSQAHRMGVEFGPGETRESIGAVTAIVPHGSNDPHACDEILFQNFSVSMGAAELFSMAVKSLGNLTRYTQSNTDGTANVFRIEAPDGMKWRQLAEAVRTSADMVGQGWEKDGEGFSKTFAQYHSGMPREAVHLDHGTQSDVIARITGERPKEVYLDGAGEEVPMERVIQGAQNYESVRLHITRAQAGMLNAEIGAAIGRKM